MSVEIVGLHCLRERREQAWHARLLFPFRLHLRRRFRLHLGPDFRSLAVDVVHDPLPIRLRSSSRSSAPVSNPLLLARYASRQSSVPYIAVIRLANRSTASGFTLASPRGSIDGANRSHSSALGLSVRLNRLSCSSVDQRISAACWSTSTNVGAQFQSSRLRRSSTGWTCSLQSPGTTSKSRPE